MIKTLHTFTQILISPKSLLVGLFVLVHGVSWAQTNIWDGSASNNWNTAANWSLNAVPTNAHDVVFETEANIAVDVNATINSLTIKNSSTVTFTSSGGGRIVTIDNTSSSIQAGSTLILQGSTGSGTRSMPLSFSGISHTMSIEGTLELASVGEGTVYNATNSITTVSGTIKRTTGVGTLGTITSTNSNLRFSAGGTYSHEVNGSSIPTADWVSNSTVKITGTTTTDPTGLNQSFGNLIWNATGLGTNSVNFNPTGIAGNLEINNSTATGDIIQTSNSINVGGNFFIQGGNYVITDGNSNRTLTITGNMVISDGSLILKQGSNGSGTLNIEGDFSLLGGTITRSGSGTASINFAGNGSPQLFTSGGTVSNTINWSVNSGAFLQMAEEGTSVTGGGTFTLSSGATLGITSSAGITSTGTAGNIQVTGTRTYDSGANYRYNGDTNQDVGHGLPATVNSLIIANSGPSGSNTVTLNSSRIVSSDLEVEAGTLDLSTFTLNRVASGGSVYLEPNTALRLGGTSNFPSDFLNVTIGCTSTVEYYADGPQTIAPYPYGNLILSGSGIKTLQPGTSQICSDLSLTGTAATTAVIGLTIGGNADFGIGTTFSAGNFTHQINGNWSNQGSFYAAASTFNFAGSDPGTITNGGMGDFFNLSFSGSGTKTIASNVSPTGDILAISTSVVLSGIHSLTLAAGKSMEINPSGSLTTGSGKLILEPGSLYLNRSTSDPTLEVKQTFIGDKGWRMFGTPVTTTYASLTSGVETQGFPGSTNPTLQPNLLWWNETDKGSSLQGWRQPATLSSSAPAGRGHYFYIFNGETKPGGGNYTDLLPKNLSVTGTEVNLASSVFDFGVTFTARDTSLVAQADSLVEINQADEGFNLLANPTASVIDFHSGSGWTKTNIDETVYVWDPATENFLTWNGTTGTLESGKIAPFQGFWIKANAINPVLQLNGNGAKVISSTDFFGRKSAPQKPLEIQFNVAGEELKAQSFITFGQDGNLDADPKDAYQLESLAEDWLLLYSFGSLETKSPLVINHQPELSQKDRVIPLHLAASKKGESFKGIFIMDWNIPEEWPSAAEIILMDHINQKAIDMRKESDYSFSFEAPKATISNVRKTAYGMQIPQAVVFQTPYEVGTEEEQSPNQVNARTTTGSKPKRPFTLFIGSFPGDRIEYLPDFPKLFAPVPNPFLTETKIRFYLPAAESAQIQIYDLMGKEAGSFPTSTYEAGIHELDWVPSAIDLPRGMYVIRLTTDSGQFTQKLIKN